MYGYEILKTFRFDVEGLSEPVLGEVRRQIMPETTRQQYSWWISHHYRPSAKAMTVYYPSGLSSDSAEDVEDSLLAYAIGFSAAAEIVKD